MLTRRPAALGRRPAAELTRHDGVRPQRPSRMGRYTTSAPKGRPVVPPGPRPKHNQGTIPRTPQGATGADRGDSERIGASHNSPHEGAVPWAVRNSRNTRTSTPT